MTRRRPPADSVRVPTLRIGCAGWSIPKNESDAFPAEGTHLRRYAQVFNAVEINSSFYRLHRPETYARWAAVVPADFRFSVKMPRTITHQAKLLDCDTLLADFLAGVAQLESKLGVLLLQLPPSLAWNPDVADAFFAHLRKRYRGPVACEPRHASWFASPVSTALATYGVARAAADPSSSPRAHAPAGDHRLEYVRLHGSPRRYYDSYADAALQAMAVRLRRPSAATGQRWCIFDNTASGKATKNAIALNADLGTG